MIPEAIYGDLERRLGTGSIRTRLPQINTSVDGCSSAVSTLNVDGNTGQFFG